MTDVHAQAQRIADALEGKEDLVFCLLAILHKRGHDKVLAPWKATRDADRRENALGDIIATVKPVKPPVDQHVWVGTTPHSRKTYDTKEQALMAVDTRLRVGGYTLLDLNDLEDSKIAGPWKDGIQNDKIRKNSFGGVVALVTRNPDLSHKDCPWIATVECHEGPLFHERQFDAMSDADARLVGEGWALLGGAV